MLSITTKIVAKNGSILGKIPKKSKTKMSRSSDRTYSQSQSFAGYSGVSPRASTSRVTIQSSSGEEIVTMPRRPNMSAAIDEYRSHTVLAQRPARGTTRHHREQHHEPRSAPRETRDSRAGSSTNPSRSQHPRVRTLSHSSSSGLHGASPERRRNPVDTASSEIRWLPPRRRRNPADFSSEDSDSSRSTSSRASTSSRESSISIRSTRSSNAAAEPSHLGPVTRDFLRRSARQGTGNGDAGGSADFRIVVPEGEAFFPTPKVTFLIDEPKDLICQICQSVTLDMASSNCSSSSSSSCSDCSGCASEKQENRGRDKEKNEKAQPAILPCGHIGCYNCLTEWLTVHSACPFCRKVMRHKDCRHTVEPRVITHDTVHALPRTTAEGGTIGHKCRECRVEDSQAKALNTWEELAEDLRRARRQAKERGTEEAAKALKDAEKAFETAPSRAMLDKVIRVDASW